MFHLFRNHELEKVTFINVFGKKNVRHVNSLPIINTSPMSTQTCLNLSKQKQDSPKQPHTKPSECKLIKNSQNLTLIIIDPKQDPQSSKKARTF